MTVLEASFGSNFLPDGLMLFVASTKRVRFHQNPSGMYVEQPFNIFRRVVYALKIPHYVRAIKTSSDVVLTQLLRAVTYFFEKCCVGKKRMLQAGVTKQTMNG